MSSDPYGPRKLQNEASRRHAIQAVYLADDGMEITIRKPKRSNSKSAKMWVALHQMETKCKWHGERLTDEEWKDLITAGMYRQRVVPGIDGGFVVLGQHTREMSSSEIDQIIDTACAIAGAQQVTIVFREDVEPTGRMK